MATTVCQFTTNLPKQFLSEPDILQKSTINGTAPTIVRNSKHHFFSADDWIGGFIWHYVNRANIQNFQYDLLTYDNNQLQYTVYEEGCYYDWHVDADIRQSSSSMQPISSNRKSSVATEYIRKLSFSLQLSDESDYGGGELQILRGINSDLITVPKLCGTLVVFDSRLPHRVRKVKSGIRKSLVGWIIGPRWR
jgi:PKHD-type hydroxylase